MTGFNSNIEELITKFKGLKANAQQVDFSEALLVGVNAARGAMSFRIFNKGLDSTGASFGKYIGKKQGLSKAGEKIFKGKKKFLAGNATGFSPYELKRIGRGRQVRYKDLEFTGDLRRAIRSEKESNVRVICVITNARLAKIADYQEEQIGRITGKGRVAIWQLSEQEREILKTNTSAALTQIYVRLLST